jgi:hypothetical protein
MYYWLLHGYWFDLKVGLKEKIARENESHSFELHDLSHRRKKKEEQIEITHRMYEMISYEGNKKPSRRC